MEELKIKKDDEIDDDKNDEIVHEIPIYLSQTLGDSLYLFQFPIRPSFLTYDSSSFFESKIKIAQGAVEMTLALNTDSSNFDVSKAEEIALNVDGHPRGKTVETALFPNGLMDRQIFSSVESVKNPSRYAVGILDRNELHLTPLKGILALRPNYNYLDKLDKTAKSESRSKTDLKNSNGGSQNEDDGLDEENNDGEEENEELLKPVTVKFSKMNASEMAKKSQETLIAKAAAEPWIPTKYNHIKSPEWEKESQKLFCKEQEHEIPILKISSKEYLETLK